MDQAWQSRIINWIDDALAKLQHDQQSTPQSHSTQQTRKLKPILHEPGRLYSSPESMSQQATTVPHSNFEPYATEKTDQPFGFYALDTQTKLHVNGNEVQDYGLHRSSVRPTPRFSHDIVPPDNLVPSLDAYRIRIPPPHESLRTPEPAPPQQLSPPSSKRALSDGNQEPLPIPPRSQDSQHQRYHRRDSSPDSSVLSALDIINEPFGGAPQTPMSANPEVLSHDGDYSTRHQRFMVI